MWCEVQDLFNLSLMSKRIREAVMPRLFSELSIDLGEPRWVSEAIEAVQPGNWGHVHHLKIRVRVADVIADYQGNLREDPPVVFINPWNTFARLLPSLKLVQWQILLFGSPEAVISAFLQSSYWKNHLTFFETLCASGATYPLQPNFEIKLCFVHSAQLPSDTWAALASPFKAYTFARVIVHLGLDSAAHPPVENRSADDVSAVFAADWVDDLQLEVASICDAWPPFRNLKSLKYIFALYAANASFWDCLAASADTLETLDMTDLPAQADIMDIAPSELPKLRELIYEGTNVSNLLSWLTRVRLPALKSIILDLDVTGRGDGDEVHLMLDLHAALPRTCIQRIYTINLGCRTNFEDWHQYSPILGRLASLARLNVQFSQLPSSHSIDGLVETGVEVKQVDVNAITEVFPSTVRPAITSLSLAIGAGANAHPRFGQQVVFPNLQYLRINIGVTARQWSSLFVTQVLTCLSAPALTDLEIDDASLADIIECHARLLSVCLPLWPELLCITIYWRTPLSEAITKPGSDFCALKAACQARKIDLKLCGA